MIVTENGFCDFESTVVFVLVKVYLRRTTNEIIRLIWSFSFSIVFAFTAMLAFEYNTFLVIRADCERGEMCFVVICYHTFHRLIVRENFTNAQRICHDIRIVQQSTLVRV